MAEIRISIRPLSLAAHVLIVLEAVVHLALVSKSYYWQDDLVHLDRARGAPLSTDLIVRDYHDHLEMGTNLVYWLISRLDTGSYWPAVVIVGVLTILAGVLMWRLLVLLFGERSLLLVPLALYLFSPLALVPATWFASAMQELPLQVCWLALLLALVRLDECRRWSVVALVSFAVALFFWEKALIVLPLSLLFMLLVVWRGEGWSVRLQRLWRGRMVWGALVVMAAAYVVLYLTVTDGSERATGVTTSYVRGAADMVLQVFLPANFGGPWWVQGANNTLFPATPTAMVVVFCALSAVVVAASIWVSGRRAIGAWAMVVAHLAVAIGLVLWGRAGYLDLVARDPRYLVEVTLTLALCLAAAFLPLRDEEPADRQRRTTASLGLPAGIAGAVALVASCLLTTFQLVPNVTHDFGRSYLRQAQRSMAQQPGESFVDQSIPAAIVPMKLSRALHAVAAEPGSFDVPASRLWILDGFGVARQVGIRATLFDETGPTDGCWNVGESQRSVTQLPEDLPSPAVLRIGYLAGVDGVLSVDIAGREQAVALTAGLGEVWLTLDEGGPMTMSLSTAPGEESADEPTAGSPTAPVGVCIGELTLGSPWPT